MRFWIAAALATLFVIAWTQSRSLQPQRENGILPIDPPTPYFRYSPSSAPKGRILVGHGLDASKETMQIVSAALADGGFEVYAIDLPGHGDSTVGFEASLAQQAIGRAYAHLNENTIVMGHSLTAGLLLDLAADRQFSTVVLLSPPPTPIHQLHADRVLIIASEFDAPRVREFGSIVAAVGGARVDFRELKMAGHSSAIFNPVYIREIVLWLGGGDEITQSLKRYLWIGVMLISSLGLGIILMPGRRLAPLHTSIPTVLVRYVVACIAAIFILKIFVPLAFIRIFAMDYLVSFIFVAGVVLWFQQRPELQFNRVAILKGIAAAAFVIGVMGFVVASNFLHFSLSDGRWWRFPIIVAAGVFLLTFDELAIRRISPRWKSVAVALLTRIVLWAFLLLGVLLLNRQDAFLVLIAHLMVLFWMFLWLTAEIVHRHTRDPLAASLYAALVQGWAFAAWFVTI